MSPRSCSVCLSPRRGEIDAALVSGNSLRDIAERDGVSKSALNRHRPHVSTAIVKAAERREEKIGDSLIAEVRSLQARTLRLLDDAERADDGRLRAVAISQVRENALVLSKLLAELPQGEQVIRVEYVDSEQWRSLRPAVEKTTAHVRASLGARED